MNLEDDMVIKEVAIGYSRSEEDRRESDFAVRFPYLVQELGRVGVT